MTVALADTHRNGTGAVSFPVKTVAIRLDEIGYEGWQVIMRTNPRSSVYDDLIALDDEGRWWKAFGQVVLDWNFVDEDGQPLAQPAAVSSEHDLDLPYGVIAYVFSHYLEAFRRAALVPKVLPEPSGPTSLTSGESQSSA